MDQDTANTLRWLAPIFGRKRADGSFYFSDEKVRAFLPVFLLSLGFDPTLAPPHLSAMVGELGRLAGVEMTDDKPATEAKIRAYLEAHPLDPELVFEVARGMREEMGGYSPEELARDSAALLGIARPTLIARDTPPPEGSVKSGPMARFTLDTPAKKTSAKTSAKKTSASRAKKKKRP